MDSRIDDPVPPPSGRVRWLEDAFPSGHSAAAFAFATGVGTALAQLTTHELARRVPQR